MNKIAQIFQAIITKETNTQGEKWLEEKLKMLSNDFKLSTFFMSFSAVPRFFAHEQISLEEAQKTQAKEIIAGFSPEHWTLSQVVRALLLLHIPKEDKTAYVKILHQLWDTADMEESAALYKALPLLPFPEEWLAQAIEGLRTNITPVFDAIALHNPYPALYFPDSAWNQLYLKAAFMGRPIYHIQGVKQRANQDLATIIADFAHERWAAGRTVPPDMWMAIPQFLNEALIQDVEKLLQSPEKEIQLTARLICQESPLPQAKKLLQALLRSEEEISWQSLAEQWQYKA